MLYYWIPGLKKMHFNYKADLVKNKFALVGLFMTVLLIIVAIFASWLAPYDPWEYQGEPLGGISREHPLGLNDIGQDILSELVYSARNSLSLGISVSLLATLIAVIMGLSAAASRGVWKRIVLRLIDLFLCVPEFLPALLLASYVRPGFFTLILFLAVLMWPQGARLVFMQASVLLKSGHLLAAEAFGASKKYILIRHLLPELFPILLVLLVQFLRLCIFMEVGLAFMGVLDTGVKSWGTMFHHAGQFLYGDIWVRWLLPTGLVVTWAITGFSLLGYAAEELIDPRLRKESKNY
ncbi:MAG: ABC transporter permease [Candidatus Syntrophonatronum acetioxidans]|uniref:ABC transporter permease n=1 Tax=Candidatus Syntrophonatronum acetioxidans TaxID=1795816 RepID=A0A424YCM4_9FIRM|nr:MAG: ABC transporter permease [Candidatus Syntrophonatronum acetioxidans]